MSIGDAEIVSLLRAKLFFLNSEKSRIDKERELIERLLELYGKPIPKVKVEEGEEPAVTISAQKPGVPETPHDRIIELVLTIISKNGGPTDADEIWEKVDGKVDCSRHQFYQFLSKEVKRANSSRLRRTQQGVYDKKVPAVPVKVPQEELDKAMEQARKVRERQ